MATKAKSAPKKSVNIRPLGDRILVERVEAEERTAGGILLPESAKEKPKEGKVISLGDGKQLDNGERSSFSLKKNDRPNLSGGIQYVDSARHATYVKKSVFKKYSDKLMRRFGWKSFGTMFPPSADAAVTPNATRGAKRASTPVDVELAS